MRVPRALAVCRRQRNTEEGPREWSLPKVTSWGERILAPRHSLNSIEQSRLQVGESTSQDVKERSAAHTETAIKRSRPEWAITAKVVKSLTASDTKGRFSRKVSRVDCCEPLLTRASCQS